MRGNSKQVQSSQTGIHKNLLRTVQKHFQTPYLKPVPPSSQEIFRTIKQIQEKESLPLILDAGCGTGESAKEIASQHPDKLVIGIDKSIHRLSRSGLKNVVLHENNLVLARANLVDFWLLAKQHQWHFEKQFLLYPNPWPKPKHLQRRWHAHPIFPTILSLGGTLELRTNWRLYAEEFHHVLQESSAYSGEVRALDIKIPVSPFEKKYLNSRHRLFQFIAE